MTAHIIFLVACEEFQHPTQNFNVTDRIVQDPFKPHFMTLRTDPRGTFYDSTMFPSRQIERAKYQTQYVQSL